MQKFKFRLQRVLDIKHTIEEVKRKDFNIALEKLNTEKRLLKEVLNKKLEYAKKINKLRQGIGKAEFISLYYDFLKSLSQRQLFQTKRIDMANIETEKRKKILLEAVVERKAIEQLKEKKVKEYKKELLVDEQKEMDEISSTKFSNYN